MRTPAGRRILARHAVHRLADQVRVSGMPPMLLDQVADKAARAGVLTVGPARVHELVIPDALRPV